MFSNAYKFAEDNIELYNYDEKGEVNFLEDGSVELETNSRFIKGNEVIKFKWDAPFKANKKEKNENSDMVEDLKPQDILVVAIIVFISIFYLFCDTYRNIYDYKERRKKLCTLQMR